MLLILKLALAWRLFLPPPDSSTLAPETLFDFWIGEWDLTWKDAEGNTQKGNNRIVKVLDDQVIQENFEAFSSSAEASPLKGMSLSVYNPQTERWHQAWTDNQGGYFNFIGKVEGKQRIFFTTITNQDGEAIHLRMVFRDIAENSFIWDWESSRDEGGTWKLNWQIHYQRRNS